MAYMFWELSRRPDIMKKLQAEIDEAMVDAKVVPDISVLQELPYLSAFMKEGTSSTKKNTFNQRITMHSPFQGLRLYTAVPSLLERVVPASTFKNGASDEIFDMMGYPLPPGTIVSTQAWSMHRDPSIFPFPDSFQPERWLASSTNESELAIMAQHMMPFGAGSRVCVGQTLAQVIMRIAIAAISRSFDVVAPAETNERSMEVRDSFVSPP